MKKSMRFFVTGSVQPVFFNGFIKNNADKLGVNGFIRSLEDGRIEIFIEGNIDAVYKMAPLCKRGPEHSIIRKVEEREERYQGFEGFKVLKI
ncbi:acylphosphatase [Candidatus Pacearchaeota archaeon CG10_big_fil_rev_8_21_14_0_10_34_76]|nr:MAG: acylphosphatase [Candidatus Pacearchaeota archaeon CG10_big_fil_rev_8_21_14_0_10_34_76]